MESKFSSLTRANLERLGRMLQENADVAVMPKAEWPRLSPIQTRILPSGPAPWHVTTPVEPGSHDMAFIADSSFEATLHNEDVLLGEVCWSPRYDGSDVLTLSPVSTSSAGPKSRGASPRTAAKELNIISAISCGLSSLCFGGRHDGHWYEYSPTSPAFDMDSNYSMASDTPPSKASIGRRRYCSGGTSPIRPLASKHPKYFGQNSPRKPLFPTSDNMDLDDQRRRTTVGFCSTCA